MRGLYPNGAVAQGASGAGLQQVTHVAWLRLLLPDEPPTTLMVNTLASCFPWHWACPCCLYCRIGIVIICYGAANKIVRVQLCLWPHSCVPTQVEAIEATSVTRAAWTGVTLWDTSAHASLRNAPAGPQQPAAVRLGLCYGMHSAGTHSNAGCDSCPGELAVSDSVLICVCDPRCVTAIYCNAVHAKHAAGA